MDATVYGRTLRLEGGPYALWCYRREFGSDLYQDMLASVQDGDVQLSIWLQIVWAMNRTADDSTPAYGDWLRAFPDFDLGDSRSQAVIDQAMTAGFFRQPEQAGRMGRLRGAVAGRVRSLALLLDRIASRLVAR